MLLLLPPSETKRDGGADDARLELGSLAFPALTPQRRAALAGLRRATRTIPAGLEALALGPGQRAEVERSRSVRSGPVMPALERYTGVLFDALEVASLPAAAREHARGSVAIASALFGLVGTEDRIPAYRLSHDSRLPGVSLRSLWREAIATQLAAHPGLVIDLRSESYAALGPVGRDAVIVRVVSGDARDARGRRAAISHANKSTKGRFARDLLLAGVELASPAELLDWAAAAGWTLEPGPPDRPTGAGVLELVV